jgi:hypothetical protein
MKKGICMIFCFTVVFCIFEVTAYANDFSNKAIPVFQELSKLNGEWRVAFMSGDPAAQKEKGKLLDDKKEEFNEILKTLAREYCAAPQTDLLKEFIKTLVSITDEYPTYVFAELYACDSKNVTKEILTLPLDDQKKICEDLNYGFKNITYKIEKLPNYKELKEKLDNLKKTIRAGK